MTNTKQRLAVLFLALAASSVCLAQSGATRPRRVNPQEAAPPPASSDTRTDGATSTSAAPRPRPASTAAPAAADTSRAYALLDQKQYDAALREARRLTEADPKNAEAWKIAGFAEVNLKQYAEAVSDLERALELQRAAGAEDPNTVDALGLSYARTEKFDRALPLLVAATTRAGSAPNAVLLFYRGLAEFRTGKMAEAERSFNQTVKAEPKNAAALFYLGRIAFDRQDNDSAVNLLNRATLADSRLADAWAYLTYAYMRRAEAAGAGAKADADYLSAVRASEGLLRVRSDESSTVLHAQALIAANQFARAAAALERVTAGPDAKGQTLYLLGYSHAQAKNYPKAVAALERAAAKTPDDPNVYRMLGYSYEVQRQYAKALAAYEKGLAVAPDDAYFKESAERVRPFAK